MFTFWRSLSWPAGNIYRICSTRELEVIIELFVTDSAHVIVEWNLGLNLQESNTAVVEYQLFQNSLSL